MILIENNRQSQCRIMRTDENAAPICWSADQRRGVPIHDSGRNSKAKLTPADVYWNPFSATYQTEEELWAWSGPWDL